MKGSGVLSYVSSMIDGVHYAIGVNAATLSGAVDIVVVPSPDGSTWRSTPFHVRFGKMQIIRASGTEVSVTVNDVVSPLRMKLGHAGEAFFLEQEPAAALVPAFSRPPEAVMSVPVFASAAARPPAVLTQSTPGLSLEEVLGEAKDKDEDEAPPVVPRRSTSESLLGTKDAPLATTVPGEEPAAIEWSWGQLPRVSPGSKKDSPRSEPSTPKQQPVAKTDKWTQLGASVSRLFGGGEMSSGQEIQISLCASLLEKVDEDDVETAQKTFEAKRVDFAAFNAQPTLLSSPELVVKIGNSLFPWSVAGPFLCSFVFFRKGLDSSVLSALETRNPMLSPHPRRPHEEASVAPPKQTIPEPIQTKSSSWFRYKSWLWSEKKPEAAHAHPEVTEEDSNSYYYEDEEEKATPSPAHLPPVIVTPVAHGQSAAAVVSSQGMVVVKSLVPTSDQLKSLGLKRGANKVVFSVQTGLRGVQTLSCQLFLWDANAPIVISDVDGTITRSDVPGMFLPYVGKDWSQKGVTDLFSRIQANGYNLLYLTARSMGQANSTRGFISTLTQGSSRLPNGPVFMTPDRLIHAFSREVVERRPEEFKIQCLESLKALYPPEFNPFSAGFGNRPSDVNSYLAVGIPELRIFVINPLGTVTTANITYRKTYTDLSALANDMFPAKRDDTAYNDALYWSLPIDSTGL
jgi:phosphatidate phosphatase LPIN